VGLAAQKNNYALYLTYADDALKGRLVAAYKAAGRKLDVGKARLRFRSLEELPMDVIGDIVAATPVERSIERAEAARGKRK